MRRTPLLHLPVTGLVPNRVVLRQPSCAFAQAVIFPISLHLLPRPVRESVAMNPLLRRIQILFLNRSKNFKGRLPKLSYPPTSNFISLARGFFHTPSRPFAVSFPSIATGCYLSVQIMASQSWTCILWSGRVMVMLVSFKMAPERRRHV